MFQELAKQWVDGINQDLPYLPHSSLISSTISSYSSSSCSSLGDTTYHSQPPPHRILSSDSKHSKVVAMSRVLHCLNSLSMMEVLWKQIWYIHSRHHMKVSNILLKLVVPVMYYFRQHMQMNSETFGWTWSERHIHHNIKTQTNKIS
jgi:hypothetical protein